MATGKPWWTGQRASDQAISAPLRFWGEVDPDRLAESNREIDRIQAEREQVARDKRADLDTRLAEMRAQGEVWHGELDRMSARRGSLRSAARDLTDDEWLAMRSAPRGYETRVAPWVPTSTPPVPESTWMGPQTAPDDTDPHPVDVAGLLADLAALVDAAAAGETLDTNAIILALSSAISELSKTVTAPVED